MLSKRSERRNIIDILQTILEQFNLGYTKTSVINNTMTSFSAMDRYLRILLERDMLIRKPTGTGRFKYYLTPRGKKLLKCLKGET